MLVGCEGTKQQAEEFEHLDFDFGPEEDPAIGIGNHSGSH